MSHTWKLLPLAALFALGTLLLVPGGAARPNLASAYDCDNTGTLIVTIIDDNTDDPITVEGAQVLFEPNALTGSGSDHVTDNGGEDDESDVGVITQEDTCVTEGDEVYTVTLESLPTELEDCDVNDDSDSGDVTEGDDTFLEIHVDCSDVNLTPTATATSTLGPAATVKVSSSNDNLGCGATSIVTITVFDKAGKPVAAGTLVNIVADKGSVSPASGQTTADGSVFVFYTAPSNAGGTAKITAASGSALGETEIDINCNVAPTQPPPPTTATGGSIQPPNTGDGGLLSRSDSNSWETYAGILLILASVTGTLAVIRQRA